MGTNFYVCRIYSGETGTGAFQQPYFEFGLKKKQDIHDIIIKNLGKTCFLQNMAYGNFKNLTRRTAAGKILSDKAFIIAQNPKSDGYKKGNCFNCL